MQIFQALYFPFSLYQAYVASLYTESSKNFSAAFLSSVSSNYSCQLYMKGRWDQSLPLVLLVVHLLYPWNCKTKLVFPNAPLQFNLVYFIKISILVASCYCTVDDEEHLYACKCQKNLKHVKRTFCKEYFHDSLQRLTRILPRVGNIDKLDHFRVRQQKRVGKDFIFF